MTEALYKVLKDGESCNGGTFKWSLPTAEGPGDWHEIPANQQLDICSTGFHLTNHPPSWWGDNRKVYLAETEGERTEFHGDKVAVRKVRLVEEITAEKVAAAEGITFLQSNGKVDASLLFGYGSGYGDGYGDGYGYGYGDGYGYGYGYGYGDGYGYGYGDGYGYGYGYGYGDGSS